MAGCPIGHHEANQQNPNNSNAQAAGAWEVANGSPAGAKGQGNIAARDELKSNTSGDDARSCYNA
jgi:hypothetical protein